ncbi:MAG: sulfurtransferase TusA family protein [Methyloligellaceae bacterium]
MGLFGFGKTEAAPAEPAGHITLSDGMTYEIAARIDCLGDSCPRPQLMTKKAVGRALAKDVIEVLIDNPTSMEAIPPMCPGLGATYLETVKSGPRWQVYLRKN